MFESSYRFLVRDPIPEYDQIPMLVPCPSRDTDSKMSTLDFYRINPLLHLVSSDLSLPSSPHLKESKQIKVELKVKAAGPIRNSSNRSKRKRESEPYVQNLRPKATKHRENEHKRRLEQKAALNQLWNRILNLVNGESATPKIVKEKYSLTQKLIYIDRLLHIWQDVLIKSPNTREEWENTLKSIPEM